MVFRQYRFESPLSRSEFLQQVGALVNQRFAIFAPKWGTLYGMVGDDRFEAGPGAVIWAPADVPHGVEAAIERTVMLVGITPPP